MGTHEETAVWTSESGQAKPPRADCLSQATLAVSPPTMTYGPALDVVATFFAITSPVVAGMSVLT
jgi:hypothetical protein